MTAPARTLRLAAVVALLLALALAGAARPTPAGASALLDVEVDVDCAGQQLTGPAAVSVSHVTGEAAPIALDVLLLLDVAEGAEIARIADPDDRAAAAQALYDGIAARLDVGRSSYVPLGIDLRFSAFDLLAPLVDGAPRERITDSQGIIDLAKAFLGGQRPAGIDVVYVATDLDLTAPEIGNAVAGQADCIGGVGNADTAFAVGEIENALIPDDAGLLVGPVAFYKDMAAKIMAHEIGHLMGGHHHYQECGSPTVLASAATRGEVGGCSLMTNAVDTQTLPFSVLNGAVVRGHAEEFVLPHEG